MAQAPPDVPVLPPEVRARDDLFGQVQLSLEPGGIARKDDCRWVRFINQVSPDRIQVNPGLRH